MKMNYLTFDKLQESFELVNSIYFLLLHIFLFIAILNQECSKLVSRVTKPYWEYLKQF